MKRKILKITIISLTSILALLFLFALIISPIAKSYISNHSKELLGRRVTIGKLHINVFKGSLELDSTYIYESNDKDIFASLDTFYINIELWKLLSKKIEVSDFKLVKPNISIIQNGNKFNFDDLINKKKKTNEPETHSGFPKSIRICNILIKGGKLMYEDKILRNRITMNELGVAIPLIELGHGNTNGRVHLKLGDNATIDSHLNLDMKTNDFILKLKIANLPINIIKPYLQNSMYIGQLEGLTSGAFKIIGKTTHLINTSVQGNMSGTNLLITNDKEEPLFSSKYIYVDITKINYSQSLYLLHSIQIHEATIDYVMNAGNKPNNFMALFKRSTSTQDETTSKKSSVNFNLEDLHVLNSQLIFTDKTLQPALVLPIRKVDFAIKDYNPNKTNTIHIKGTFPKSGELQIHYSANTNDLSNQQIKLDLKSFSLQNLSQYCRHYTAYDITSGLMNYSTNTLIQNNKLKSENKVDIYQMEVSKKHKDMRPEYKVPLKLALYIMKDKDDKIILDLPVQGNIKDPQFSYRKIVFQTILNLMVKVATSPFRFLSGALGLNSDQPNKIEIDALQPDFSAEQYSKINNLAEIIRKKPGLTYELTQFTDMSETVKEYAWYKTKYYYLTQNAGSDKKDVISPAEVISFDDEKAITAYIDTLFAKKRIPYSNETVKEKALQLFIPDSLENELLVHLSRRNTVLSEYMQRNLNMKSKNIRITTARRDSLKTYRNKSCYKIKMHMDGE